MLKHFHHALIVWRRRRACVRQMEQLRRWLLEENMRELQTLVCSDGKDILKLS